MKIFWSSQARKDLRAIRAYIAKDSAFYAERMVTRIVERTEILSRHPNSSISQVSAGWKYSLSIGIYSTKGSVRWDLRELNEIILGRRDEPNQIVVECGGKLGRDAAFEAVKDGQGPGNAVRLTKAVSAMQACAVHLCHRTPRRCRARGCVPVFCHRPIPSAFRIANASLSACSIVSPRTVKWPILRRARASRLP